MLKVGDKFYDKSKKTIMENVLAKLQSTLPTQHNFSNLDPSFLFCLLKGIIIKI